MNPRPAPDPTSRADPVPGYSGDWWMETNRTSSTAWKMSLVPLPWWTSQSTIITRSRPCAVQRMARRDRPRVEEAEPHRAVDGRVMAGRPVRAEPVDGAPVEQPLDQLDRAPGGVPRSLARALADHGVEVDLAPSARAYPLDPLDIGLRVHGGDGRALRPPATAPARTRASRARSAPARWPRSWPAARDEAPCRAPATTDGPGTPMTYRNCPWMSSRLRSWSSAPAPAGCIRRCPPRLRASRSR